MSKKTKSFLIGGIILVVCVALFVGIWLNNKPTASANAKEYTLEVVDNEGNTKTYNGTTEEEYLKGLMDELKAAGDFDYSGSESEYGIMIESVNGLKAVYAEDGAYWSIYVNGEYGMYGADQQVITSGDTYTLKYELAQ